MNLHGGGSRRDFMSRLRMGGDRNGKIRWGGRGDKAFMERMWGKTAGGEELSVPLWMVWTPSAVKIP